MGQTPGPLLIVGCGLLGASVGLAAKRADARRQVIGFDVRPAHMTAARKAGAIDREAAYLDAAAGRADTAVIAVPIAAAEGVLDELANSPAALVTDTLSTKRTICRLAAGRPAMAGRFVGAHPMAGGTTSGPEAARADLFDGAACLLTPAADADEALVARAEAFWSGLGCHVARTFASHHDRMAAQISHVPHVVAAALARLPEDVARQFAGPGFRDATRIAAGDAGLWTQIALDNADEVMLALRECVDDLRAFAGALEAGDADALRQWLAAAARLPLARRDG